MGEAAQVRKAAVQSHGRDRGEGLRIAQAPVRAVKSWPANLAEREHHLGNQLSGGEQQMLEIARALSTNPPRLILDEATEGLAPVIREEIWRCLRQLKAAGQTTLVVDKYLDRLLGLADHHVVLERGLVVWQGDSAALDGDRGIWTRYLGV